MSKFWQKVNLNDRVRYKINPRGLELRRSAHDKLNGEMHGFLREFQPPEVDADGWSTDQLWHLMEDFGPYITLGMGTPIETFIEIEFDDQK